MEQARAARLGVGMVLALRLYSTAVYMSINAPLREGTEHPMPVLVHVLTEAIKRLRTVEGRDATQNEPLTLWRGMRNVAELPQRFLDEGGTERAPPGGRAPREASASGREAEWRVAVWWWLCSEWAALPARRSRIAYRSVISSIPIDDGAR